MKCDMMWAVVVFKINRYILEKKIEWALRSYARSLVHSHNPFLCCQNAKDITNALTIEINRIRLILFFFLFFFFSYILYISRENVKIASVTWYVVICLKDWSTVQHSRFFTVIKCDPIIWLWLKFAELSVVSVQHSNYSYDKCQVKITMEFYLFTFSHSL